MYAVKVTMPNGSTTYRVVEDHADLEPMMSAGATALELKSFNLASPNIASAIFTEITDAPADAPAEESLNEDGDAA